MDCDLYISSTPRTKTWVLCCSGLKSYHLFLTFLLHERESANEKRQMIEWKLLYPRLLEYVACRIFGMLVETESTFWGNMRTRFLGCNLQGLIRYRFYIFMMSSHVASGSRLYYCWEQRYLDDQLVSSCLSSPAMIVGWGEVSEVDVETLGGRLGGRDTGWEWEVGGIPLLLSFTPHSSDTHNLTCLSLTVFSQSHVCHANHIAALIQCGKKWRR